MKLTVKTQTSSYDVIIKKNVIEDINKYLNLKRKVLIISDDGVPSSYIDCLTKQIDNCFVYVIRQGEKSKNIDNYQQIISYMIDNSFTRKDAIIALGGGVVGDLSGFIAATYMRGITFYNIPTTLLSQVDSSIGGKTAIDYKNIKNIIGSFYQPEMVLIDTNTLKTLDERQLHAGLVESIKMALTCNEDLFNLIANSNDLFTDLEEIIFQSLLIKKNIVEQDTLEQNVRKVLNFGHSIGHAIESCSNMQLLHGECVGIGMTYMVDFSIKEKLIYILKKYNLPVKTKIDKEKIIELLSHDKKANSDKIDIILVNKIGSYEIKSIKISEIINYL